MTQAIGILELTSIARGMELGDVMLKSANVQLLLCRRATTLFTRKQQTYHHHRREVYVQLLRQLLLKNLTQLLERSPEYVSLTESK